MTGASGEKREPRRLRVVIRGAVQGVGFRPFAHRLAGELGLAGWAGNTPQGLFIEVEGPPDRLDKFLLRVEREKPPRASIQGLEHSRLDPCGFSGFEIRKSDETGPKTALILPDIATCPDCLRELFDPSDRRHRYPFTNCTNCGPRFSIIEALPYDRSRTTMRGFAMCGRCRAEYENPDNRRFHAQPNACPDCGPRLELWDRAGKVPAKGDEALARTVEALRKGSTVAVKGLGGFHLMVDARSDEGIRRLREKKRREEKPFAVMAPSLDAAKALCEIGEMEEHLLSSPEAPIVLLRRRKSEVSDLAAPGNPNLGLMLPYTPLHHLIISDAGFPIVATSGNVSDEPICIDEREALERLGGCADLFLVHDRPIARHVDDSIVRMTAGRPMILRRARGYAPLPVSLNLPPLPPALAVGAHLKNTVALSVGKQAFVGQHIGDLETAAAVKVLKKAISDFESLYQTKPEIIVCDQHPDYASTRVAESTDLPIRRVQHHHAHVLACMAENEIEEPVLGVAWDGTGYGEDGTVWGGEFLKVSGGRVERFGYFRRFRLPGGEKAVREPWRAAIGLLYELYGDDAFDAEKRGFSTGLSPQDNETLRKALKQDINAPLTSSVGRFFDAVAAISGLRRRNSYEGQAAMALEFAAEEEETKELYPFEIRSHGGRPWIVDWDHMGRWIPYEAKSGSSPGRISAIFHNTLVDILAAMAQAARCRKVALTGGCFQNRRLTEHAVRRLREEGFQVYWHQRIPPNDGGIAPGQLAAAAMLRE